MRKRIIKSVLVICTVSALISSAASAANGNLPGLGSESNPYLIEDFEDFTAFCGDSSYWSYWVHTRLENDIDLNPNLPGRQIYTQAPIAGDTDTDYTYDGVYYLGVFDGNNHVIRNLNINGAYYCGLFGATSTISQIKDLGLENVLNDGLYFVGGLVGKNHGSIMNCYSTGSITGGSSVGGLVGNANENSRINKSYSTGSVTGDSKVGGLVGEADEDSSIDSSYSDVEVTVQYGSAGGLVGWNNGSISSSYSMGNVIGGFEVGGLMGTTTSSSCSIVSSYSTGSVTGSSRIGGLVGYAFYGINVTSSFWDVDTSDVGSSGDDNYGAIGKTSIQMQTLSTFENPGWDFTDVDGDPADWQMPGNDYPILAWQSDSVVNVPDVVGMLQTEAESVIEAAWLAVGTVTTAYSNTVTAGKVISQNPVAGTSVDLNIEVDIQVSLGAFSGSGTESDPYLIEDYEDFEAFCGDSSYWASGVYMRLESDIDLDPGLSGRQIYTHAPIAGDTNTDYTFDGTAYAGVFDGNHHVIRNLTIDGAYHCGMFGAIASEGMVINLGIENVSVEGTGFIGGLVGDVFSGSITNCYSIGVVSSTSTSYSSYAGGLVGYQSEGTIANCHSSGTVSNQTSTSDSYSYTGGLVGGLVGDMDEAITNCYSTVDVFSTSKLSSYAGGLVGGVNGVITHCYSTGTVSSTSSSSSYAVSSQAGGLVGQLGGGAANNCYSSGNVSSSATAYRNSYSYTGGLVGDHTGGDISDCYSSGSVSSSAVSTARNSESYAGGLIGRTYNAGYIINCYSIGTISSSAKYSYIGGLAGSKEYAYSIINCFWDVEASGMGTSGDDNYGAIGKTTNQMQTQFTFTDAGWDFVNETENGTDDIWWMPTGDYPRLALETTGSSDISGDGKVDLIDYVKLSEKWLEGTCDGPDWCGGADIDRSGDVGLSDFLAFADNWMEGV